jgi:hypothetical protein
MVALGCAAAVPVVTSIVLDNRQDDPKALYALNVASIANVEPIEVNPKALRLMDGRFLSATSWTSEAIPESLPACGPSDRRTP